MEITKEKTENQTWLDLPLEILISVMSYLEIKDNVRASAVCKSWQEAAVSVRIVDKPPWLIHFPESRLSYEFYNPSSSNKCTVKLPKLLTGSKVRYSKDGWLLMSKELPSPSSDFALFNPFTMDIVVLPHLHQLVFGYQLVGFSCAPTSSDCVVFIIKDYNRGDVTIRTWSPGETTWTSMQVTSKFLHFKRNYVVFSNGVFYCLNSSDCLAVFDPSLRSWNVLDVPPPTLPDFITYENGWFRGKFMVGHKDDIFIIGTLGEKPLVFKLDRSRGLWEKEENLGSLTIFANVKSCESRTYVHDGMLRNSIYFPKLCYNDMCCVTYSFDERRWHPQERNLNLERKQRSSKNIWIKAPENAFELV